MADEIAAGSILQAVWTKAIAESDGTTEAARRLYIRYRIADLDAIERANNAAKAKNAATERRKRADSRYATSLPVAVISLAIFSFLCLARPSDPSELFPHFPYMEWLIPLFAGFTLRCFIGRKRAQAQSHKQAENHPLQS
ncbi:MAG: hypothetical protein ACR2NX_09525 [Chthoniobacterales bacterium]